VLPFGLLGVQVILLPYSQWSDAYVTATLAAVRGCEQFSWLRVFSSCEAWLGAAFVAAGVMSARRRRVASPRIATVLLSLGIALAFVYATKLLFVRPRPGTLPWSAAEGGFPSGHVANAVLTVLASLALFGEPGRPPSRRHHAIVAGAGATFILVTAFSRVYLCAHWMTDVVGSALLSIGLWEVMYSDRDDGQTAVRRLVAAAAATACLFAAVTTGARITLASPSSFYHVGPVAHGRALRLASAAGTDSCTQPTYEVQVGSTDGVRAIVRAVVWPKLIEQSSQCGWLGVAVDDRVVGMRPLLWQWQTIEFALPELREGRHALRLVSAGVRCGRQRFPIATALVEVDGAGVIGSNVAGAGGADLRRSPGVADTRARLDEEQVEAPDSSPLHDAAGDRPLEPRVVLGLDEDARRRRVDPGDQLLAPVERAELPSRVEHERRQRLAAGKPEGHERSASSLDATEPCAPGTRRRLCVEAGQHDERQEQVQGDGGHGDHDGGRHPSSTSIRCEQSNAQRAESRGAEPGGRHAECADDGLPDGGDARLVGNADELRYVHAEEGGGRERRHDRGRGDEETTRHAIEPPTPCLGQPLRDQHGERRVRG
jgi:membrane-associated phospholipid phosphatase